MANKNLEKLFANKAELEASGKTDTLEYIKCIANIIYFSINKNNANYSCIKTFFCIGLEQAYNLLNKEISNEVDKALDLIFAGDFKGFCLMSAIIASLEKSKEDKTE